MLFPIQVKHILSFILSMAISIPAFPENRMKIPDGYQNDFECHATILNNSVIFTFTNVIKEHKDLYFTPNDVNSLPPSWLIYFSKSDETGFDIGVRYEHILTEQDILKGNFQAIQAPIKLSLQKTLEGKYGGYHYLLNQQIRPFSLDEEKLYSNHDSNDVTITLKNAKETEFFFNDIPKRAHFWIFWGNRMPKRCLTQINQAN